MNLTNVDYFSDMWIRKNITHNRQLSQNDPEICIHVVKSPFLYPGVSKRAMGLRLNDYSYSIYHEGAALTTLLYDRWKNSCVSDPDILMAIVQYPEVGYFEKNQIKQDKMCKYARSVVRSYAHNPKFLVLQLVSAALGAPDAHPCNIPPLRDIRNVPVRDIRIQCDTPVPLNNFPDIMMPYISSIRWSTELDQRFVAPWKTVYEPTHVRKIKFSYIGSRNTLLKSKIVDFCQQNNDICTLLEGDNGKYSNLYEISTIKRALKIKQNSVFCLEPPGLYLGRKSQMDALLSGCIPIFFKQPHINYEDFLPLHFHWKRNASIIIDEHQLNRAFLTNLYKQSNHRQFQESIANNAHNLVYAFDNFKDDAINIIARHINTKI